MKDNDEVSGFHLGLSAVSARARPNLTDVSRGWILTLETRLGHRPFPSIFPESYHLVTNWLWKEGNGQEPVNFVKDEEVPSLRRVKIGTSSSASGAEILFKVNPDGLLDRLQNRFLLKKLLIQLLKKLSTYYVWKENKLKLMKKNNEEVGTR